MKVFMLGWEFPPFISGGLGTACYGLTKAMSKMGLDVTFVLPKAIGADASSPVRMLSPASLTSNQISDDVYTELERVKFCAIPSQLSPYDRPDTYQKKIEEILREKRKVSGAEYETFSNNDINDAEYYGDDIFAGIYHYAVAAVRLALKEDFDVIHAHDWMTYQAGVAVASMTGKPLVVHVHSTEFDRSGENVNQAIYDIERKGMHAADRVIAVSYLTKNIIMSRYGVKGDKVEVVYNGVEWNGNNGRISQQVGIKKDEKLVLFLGRITMQKGPEYFLEAAKKVLDVMDDVKFVMAGSGDMMHRIIEMAANMGIGNKVLFTGFLRGDDVRKVYQMADLYVMPSVSEPFGIAPLEALNHDVPVLISKQSGVSEVLTHVLKVDFWDTSEMANKMIAVLRYTPLQMTLREHGNFEVRKLKWEDAARKCAGIYCDVITG